MTTLLNRFLKKLRSETIDSSTRCIYNGLEKGKIYSRKGGGLYILEHFGVMESNLDIVVIFKPVGEEVRWVRTVGEFKKYFSLENDNG